MEYSELERTGRPMAEGRARHSACPSRWLSGFSAFETHARLAATPPFTNRRSLITNHESRPTNQELPVTNYAVLPETGERIESPLTHRKQTIGIMSTRNWNEGVSRVTFSAFCAVENHA